MVHGASDREERARRLCGYSCTVSVSASAWLLDIRHHPRLWRRNLWKYDSNTTGRMTTNFNVKDLDGE